MWRSEKATNKKLAVTLGELGMSKNGGTRTKPLEAKKCIQQMGTCSCKKPL